MDESAEMSETALLRSKTLRKSQTVKIRNQYCLRVLCEDENNWHPCGLTIEYENSSNIPEAHFSYLLRIMSLIKQSNSNLAIINQAVKLDELLDFIEDNMPATDEETIAANNSEVFNFKESFNSVSYYFLVT